LRVGAQPRPGERVLQPDGDLMSDVTPHPHDGDGYDPNQPRVPAGHSDGGQWTDKPGGGAPLKRDVVVDRSGQEPWGSFVNAFAPDGTLAEQRVFNRDRSRIVSQFDETDSSGWDERHTVVTADGSKVVFENAGDVQKIYDGDGRPVSASVWKNDGPEPPKVQLAFLPLAAGTIAGPSAALAGRLAVQKAIEAGLVLFTWLSTRNGPDRTAFISFPAYVYAPGLVKEGANPKEQSPPVRVGQLTEKELTDVCKKYVDVQKITNVAALKAKLERRDWSPTQFGTAVHWRVAQNVNGFTDTGEPRTPDNPEDPNFRAESSFLKALADDPTVSASDKDAASANVTLGPRGHWPRYGQLGTVRVDVLEDRQNGTVCVYDIKTGKQTLSPARIREIVQSVLRHYSNARQIIITEVRPRASGLR
jgi:hypothetical protein